MSEFSVTRQLAVPLSQFSPASTIVPFKARLNLGSLDNSSSGTVSQNRACFYPFAVGDPILVSSAWWRNGTGTINGSVECGIYTEQGRRLVTTGSVTQVTSNVIQSASLSSPLHLTFGVYYAAFASNSATGTFFRWTVSENFRMLGWTVQASAFPLPATATFAAANSLGFPVFGFE